MKTEEFAHEVNIMFPLDVRNKFYKNERSCICIPGRTVALGDCNVHGSGNRTERFAGQARQNDSTQFDGAEERVKKFDPAFTHCCLRDEPPIELDIVSDKNSIG